MPEHLYKKAPTANLEDDRPSLPDEVALGVTYDNIDDYLEGKNVPEQVARTIENWYLKTEHKRRPPITVLDRLEKVIISAYLLDCAKKSNLFTPDAA